MKTEILSLKNIYKFLTTNDYPIYSEGIIRKKDKKGLTLTNFCQENILIDFKNRKNGKVIWRTEGTRNRYISEICNRSGSQMLHKDYVGEVLAAADSETVLRQIYQMVSFLLDRQYNPEAFWKKLPAYMELLEKEDSVFSEDVSAYFKQALKQYQGLRVQGMMENTFCCGWFLTYLILLALTGNEEKEHFILKVKEDKTYSLPEMLKRYKKNNQNEAREVRFLTGNNTELSRPPLGTGHFFGRQAELFELSEMLVKGGQYLISGMGGCGKTELMRQFLKVCVEESLVDYICIVQYEGGLAKSVVNAFPQIHGSDLKESYNEALAHIRLHGDKRILMIIDNMDGGVDEKELEALCELPATIFATSRYQRMKGFKAYRLQSIGKEAGSLIFRDNYGSYLAEEDKQTLEDIVSKELWCHTLTLRLLARTAKNNGWTLSKLKSELHMGHTPSGYTEAEKYENLKQVYRQMYVFAALSKKENALLRALAALPYRNYETAWIQHYLKAMLSEQENIEEKLERFWLSGWLEKSETGYSMHPFISECVLSTPLQEKEMTPFLDGIISEWEQLGKKVDLELLVEVLFEHEKYMESHEELLQTTMLLQFVLGKLSGKLQETYVKLYLLAMELEVGILDTINIEILKKLRTKETSFSKEIQIGILFVHCAFELSDIDLSLEHFHKIVEDDTISDNVKCSLAHGLATRLFCIGRPEESESLYDFMLERSSMLHHHMAACLGKGQILTQIGDFAAVIDWLQKGIAIGKDHVKDNDKYMFALLSTLCSVLLAIGNLAEGEKMVAELEKTVQQSYLRKMMFHADRGFLAMMQGKEGFGIEDLEESAKLAEVMYHENDNPAETIAPYYANLAVAYNKNKQYEEAEAIYKRLLALYEGISGYEFNKRTALNNMCVMYLDWGKTEKAMEYLPKSYEMSKALGGISLGETAYTYSKAYRALGNREKELEYLKEAIPIFEQFYGAEHPKMVDAKARLTE